jgi:hypothetical protein
LAGLSGDRPDRARSRPRSSDEVDQAALDRLIEAWPDLSPAIRRGIVAMVEAAVNEQ